MPFKNEERIFPRDYENRIFCEDCLTFMKEIPDESVFLILTDPPYGIHYSNQSRRIRTLCFREMMGLIILHLPGRATAFYA